MLARLKSALNDLFESPSAWADRMVENDLKSSGPRPR